MIFRFWLFVFKHQFRFSCLCLRGLPFGTLLLHHFNGLSTCFVQLLFGLGLELDPGLLGGVLQLGHFPVRICGFLLSLSTLLDVGTKFLSQRRVFRVLLHALVGLGDGIVCSLKFRLSRICFFLTCTKSLVGSILFGTVHRRHRRKHLSGRIRLHAFGDGGVILSDYCVILPVFLICFDQSAHILNGVLRIDVLAHDRCTFAAGGIRGHSNRRRNPLRVGCRLEQVQHLSHRAVLHDFLGSGGRLFSYHAECGQNTAGRCRLLTFANVF